MRLAKHRLPARIQSRCRRRIRRILHSALALKGALLLVFACPGLAYSPHALAAAPRTDPLLASLAANPADQEAAIECLGEAIYYEAGFEPQTGQEAVGQVILNRARNGHFPGDVCGVVYQGSERRTGCQFSFTCDGSLTRRPPEAEQLEQARRVANLLIDGLVFVPEVGAATHYHANYVHPYWAPTLQKLATVGRHVFYR
jgi:spore germination cell wall hydrolase CwlJ-like protein